ncbi:Hypothetical predicted protein [Paramuricea clavata]|uniref:Uncharacterized protein n=1 Tax=Paramuricea clavata TaxID=317549 RepID=A0A6S7HCQ1_PARCT|nr:Hypothetical predicted protein [Paramuricea clavata]
MSVLLSNQNVQRYLSQKITYSYISKESLCPDVNTDILTKTIANKLASAKLTDGEVQALLIEDDGLDVLMRIGYRGVPQRETVSSSKDIIRSTCINDQFSTVLSQLMQLEEGLSSCGLLESVHIFPEVWKPIFTPSNQFQLTGDQLLDEATGDYSSSQILKALEINTYKVFFDVIQDLYEEG